MVIFILWCPPQAWPHTSFRSRRLLLQGLAGFSPLVILLSLWPCDLRSLGFAAVPIHLVLSALLGYVHIPPPTSVVLLLSIPLSSQYRYLFTSLWLFFILGPMDLLFGAAIFPIYRLAILLPQPGYSTPLNGQAIRLSHARVIPSRFSCPPPSSATIPFHTQAIPTLPGRAFS